MFTGFPRVLIPSVKRTKGKGFGFFGVFQILDYGLCPLNGSLDSDVSAAQLPSLSRCFFYPTILGWMYSSAFHLLS